MAGSTPIYGFPYPQSTDLVADYPTLGQELATDVETVISGLGSGLNIVTPTSIANSGGSASASGAAVTFTGVSSVSLNGIFSATYDNYRIMVKFAHSSSSNLTARLRTSSDDTATNYADQLFYGSGTAVAANRISGQSFWRFGYCPSSEYSVSSVDIFSPNIAEATRYTSTSTTLSGASVESSIFGGMNSQTTQNTGLTLLPGAGVLTGKIRVYGYNNS